MTQYNPTPETITIPETLGGWRLREAEDNRSKIVTDSYVDGQGVYRWFSNDAPVPLDFFRNGYMVAPVGQSEAISASVRSAISSYRQFRAENGYSAEERFEMRAAMGGETDRVVDIFTGEVIRF